MSAATDVRLWRDAFTSLEGFERLFGYKPDRQGTKERFELLAEKLHPVENGTVLDEKRVHLEDGTAIEDEDGAADAAGIEDEDRDGAADGAAIDGEDGTVIVHGDRAACLSPADLAAVVLILRGELTSAGRPRLDHHTQRKRENADWRRQTEPTPDPVVEAALEEARKIRKDCRARGADITRVAAFEEAAKKTKAQTGALRSVEGIIWRMERPRIYAPNFARTKVADLKRR